MKKSLKSLLSIVLSMLTIVSICALNFSAAAFDDNYTGITDIPNIYIEGQGSKLVNADGTVIYDGGRSGIGGIADEDFDLSAAVSECMPYFKDALLKGDWEPYTEALLNVIDTVYSGAIMDKNGDPQNGSHISSYDTQVARSRTNRTVSGGKYAIKAYTYNIDWRVDPFVTADDLNQFIQNVKAATGKSKVNITARCEGTNILAAYLERYGAADVNCCCFYVNSVYGVDNYSAVFSGNMEFSGEAITRFKEQSEFTIGDELVNELIDNTLSVLVDTYAFDATTLIASPIIHTLYTKAVTKAILHSYGTMPGIWAMISKKDYAQAKKYIFDGVEDEYAGLIEKLDYYDVHVRQRIDELFKQAQADGAKIQFVGKYGDYALIPISNKTGEYNDGMVVLTSGAPGATVAKFGKKLSSDYIAKAEAAGNGAYISADKVVDASTCLFAETTWIIHNSEHRDFPECIHELIGDFYISNGTMTVSNQTKFPQFLHYNSESSSLSPLTAESGAQAQPASHNKQTIKDKFIAFLKTLLNFLKNLISGNIKFK